MVEFFQIFFFFQAEDGIRYRTVTGVQTCALPDRLHPHYAGDPFARQREKISRTGQSRRRYPGSLFADRRRRLSAQGDAARPQEPLGYRQQRADAAPERGACALVDRAGPAEGEFEAAAERGETLAWRKAREIRHSNRAF